MQSVPLLCTIIDPRGSHISEQDGGHEDIVSDIYLYIADL